MRILLKYCSVDIGEYTLFFVETILKINHRGDFPQKNQTIAKQYFRAICDCESNKLHKLHIILENGI